MFDVLQRSLFSFAKTAKTRFENGTMLEKKEIIQALGSNLYLQDKSLVVELNTPLKILKALTPDARIINQRLEPVLQGDLNSAIEMEYSRNEIWLGRKDSNPRMPGPKPGALPLGDSPMVWEL